METIDGKWIMYGVSADDAECIHTVEEAVDYIEQVGFLPLFKNEIPGFSLEERTIPEGWWSGNPSIDPWEWREIIAQSGKVAYGKFFDKKAGFISLKWFPEFANVRRDGYDFDSLWEDEKASMRQKKIMDLFMEEHADEELFSFDIKARAGFGKGGEKGFEAVLAGLQMQTYLVMRDFQQKTNKKGQKYGWKVAIYSTPEHLFGTEVVGRAYKEKPEVSAEKIRKHIQEIYPIATQKQIKKVFGI